MDRTLEAEIANQNGIAVIDLKGEISSQAENKFFMAYEQASRQNPKVVLLNMEAVEYINSAGIALIIRLVIDARQKGFRVGVSGLTDHYREIFHITRLDDFIELYTDRDSALQDFSNLTDSREGRQP